jgi:hypothetical protein
MKPNKLALLAAAVAVTFAATACHRQQTGESGGEVSPATTGADTMTTGADTTATGVDTSATPTNPPPAAPDTSAAGRDTTKMVGDTTGTASDTTMGGVTHDTTMTKTDSTNKVPPIR